MMAEYIVCALFWYGLVGWCNAELHRHSGFCSRYSGAKYWISWTVMYVRSDACLHFPSGAKGV